jgi:hypothetical protein
MYDKLRDAGDATNSSSHRHPTPENSRQVGLILDGKHMEGCDPRTMSRGDFLALGHGKISPIKAIRLRCLDCCVGQPGEVRKCPAVECPSWPFRMGVNPWHGKDG